MAPTLSKLVPDQQSGSILLHNHDVEIRVLNNSGEYTSFLAHKSCLASSSSFFKLQLQYSFQSSSVIIIEIKDFPPEIVSAYLNFIYQHQEQLLDNCDVLTLFQLFNFAGKYDVRSLQGAIIDVLEEYKVCHRNFPELVSILGENRNLEEACTALKIALSNFIALNLKSVDDISQIFISHLTSSENPTLNVPILELLREAKKTVRFSETVQKQTYSVNSAIVSKTAKNKKKAEKKRKALEKRSSESDASSVDEKVIIRQIAKSDISGESFDDFCNDSGLASSLEESMNLNVGVALATSEDDNCSEMLLKEGVDNNPFKSSNEYIFNLDF